MTSKELKIERHKILAVEIAQMTVHLKTLKAEMKKLEKELSQPEEIPGVLPRRSNGMTPKQEYTAVSQAVRELSNPFNPLNRN